MNLRFEEFLFYVKFVSLDVTSQGIWYFELERIWTMK